MCCLAFVSASASFLSIHAFFQKMRNSALYHKHGTLDNSVSGAERALKNACTFNKTADMTFHYKSSDTIAVWRESGSVNLLNNTSSIFPPSVWEAWVSRTFWCTAESECPSLTRYLPTIKRSAYKSPLTLQSWKLFSLTCVCASLILHTTPIELHHQISCVKDFNK